MTDKIKAIIIDPHLRLIIQTEVEDSLEGLQHAIGDNQIELVYLDDGNIMYVDSEGLFKQNQRFFIYNNRPFAGKAIVLGDDPENGKTVSTKSSVTDIASHVQFRTIEEIQAMGLG